MPDMSGHPDNPGHDQDIASEKQEISLYSCNSILFEVLQPVLLKRHNACQVRVDRVVRFYVNLISASSSSLVVLLFLRLLVASSTATIGRSNVRINICQIEFLECQKGCQKLCQVECQIDRMADRMQKIYVR